MKHDLKSLKSVLKNAPAFPVKAQLARMVPFGDLTKYAPPNWLYTSGKSNRYNPAGVNCVYFGETREVVQAEYDGMWQGLAGENQPVTNYFAAVDLRRVLDLTDAATLKALNMDEKDLFKNWRRAKRPTQTQLLGQAVEETGLFSAIRYPSKAASVRKQQGVNFVIFQKCVQSPDSVSILGPSKKPLQKWP